MKCLGRTRERRRCRNEGEPVFCNLHRHQARYWLATAVSALAVLLATLSGLYQDLIRFLPLLNSHLEISGSTVQTRTSSQLSDSLVRSEGIITVFIANEGRRKGWIESCSVVPRSPSPPPGSTTCTPDVSPIEPGESTHRVVSIVTDLHLTPEAFVTANMDFADAFLLYDERGRLLTEIGRELYLSDIGWGLHDLTSAEREITAAHATRLDEKLKLANEQLIRAAEEPLNAESYLLASKERLQEALDDGFHYAPVWTTLAIHRALEGDMESALRAAARATLLDPQYSPGFYALGCLNLSVRRYDAAEPALLAALELQPNNADYLSSVGMMRAREGRLHEAEMLFNKVLEEAPYHQSALNNMGALLGMKGRHWEAIRLLSRTLEYEHDNVPSHLNLGNAYMALNMPEKAVSVFQEVVHLAPERSDGYLLLASALDELGRTDEAKAVLRSAGARGARQPAPAWSLVSIADLARTLSSAEENAGSSATGAGNEAAIESMCEISSDPTYGWTIENPIKVGGTSFRSFRARTVLNSFGLPDGTALLFERLGSDLHGGVPIDQYEMTLGNKRKIFYYIWVDNYRYEPALAPKGLICLKPIELEPMEDVLWFDE